MRSARGRAAAAVVLACLLGAGCGPVVALRAATLAATIPPAAVQPQGSRENLGSAMLQLACDHALSAPLRLVGNASVQPGPADGQTVRYRIRGMDFDFERTSRQPTAVHPRGTDADAALLLASGAFVLPTAYCRDIFPQAAARTAFLALTAAVRHLRAALGQLG